MAEKESGMNALDTDARIAWEALDQAFQGVLDLHAILHVKSTNWTAERLYIQALATYQQALAAYIQVQVRVVLATAQQETA